MKTTHALSFAILLLFLVGLALRKKRALHMTLMQIAIACDLGLVLYLEITRDAINTAMNPTHPFVVFHVIISVATVVGYFHQIYAGYRYFKQGLLKKAHRIGGMVTISLRMSNFFTSLWIARFLN